MRSLRILTCDGIRCAAAVLLGFSACSRAADWTQWRGPLHNNVAPEGEQAATKWSASQNVRWKAQVPGRGHSTPVIAGDLIVLTTADERSQAQGFVAYRRSTGEQLWLAGISQGGFPKIHVKNTHASSTPAWADGLFFATFCHHGQIEAAAVTAQGKVRWKKNIGPFSPRAYEYGYGASPTVYGDTLIVTAECDTSSWMKALDVKTGRVLWQQRRPQSLNWASPIVAELGGREQLVISGGHMIAAYDPASGQPLWTARCLTMATCGTCVWDDGIVVASGGFPDAETAAVAADGSGRVLWSNRVKCYEQSMLCHDGHVYALADSGVAYCWDVRSGREMWKKRLAGPVSASPLLVGDTIYASNEKGTTFVFQASPQRFRLIARNQLGQESFASPVVADGVLYLRVAEGRRSRRQEWLYAIAE